MKGRFASARDLVRALGGKWRGGHNVCRCPAHDDSSPSLSVSQTRDGRVLVHCHAGCPQMSVIEALKGMGLWGDGELTRDPSYPQHLTIRADGLADNSDRERRQAARDVWDAGRAAAGTLAETYLRARGIRLPVSSELRFTPSLRHREAGRGLPAMLARISDGDFCAVQRTWLRADGSGKADVRPAKMTLGPMASGAVRLLSCSRDTLGLAEGVETALSAAQLYSLPVWATLSANRLGKIRLPEHVRAVVIFADAGDVGWREAEAASDLYEAQGRKVEIVLPGAHFAKAGADDFNTILMRSIA